MSAAPPGVDGAMMRIGRTGQSAAAAAPAHARPAATTATTRATARRFILLRTCVMVPGMMRRLRKPRKHKPNWESPERTTKPGEGR